MALQGSGAISFLQMQSEFGGANPISMSEYYKGGVYVPQTVTVPAGAWVYAPPTVSNTFIFNSTTARSYFYWNIDVITPINVTVSGLVPVLTIGSYEYSRGSLWNSSGSAKTGGVQSYYTLQRRSVASTQAVNGSVPSSGAMGLGHFYGGRKT